ncbi:diguanylate cyclase [Pseudodesulfovibrio sp. zrk46]|uniref:two-component system response regulator n=1 Tax=Pseudodesulfovibrio sp. zrk46 TaxID=2725288 RepID=UPI001449F699|nr:diguanylate cyclase [Pseudodesulfovibrio sp. zrk46]QJB54904.1 diguanylate cyclase [Pseudodesulfovibrio sp. zrk46]
MKVEKQKVLIVDDSQTNLALLDHMLSQEGCEIIQAKSGGEAVNLVKENDFAVILLDIQMPGMNGYEAATRIKKMDKGRHVPIIYITAIFQDEDNVRQGYETGAVDYLFRPVDVDALKSKVRVFLELHKQKQLLEEEIEQRTQSQKQLTQAEEKYRSIFERAVEGLFQSTNSGQFKEVNPALVEIFGYESAEEMIGVPGIRSTIMFDEDERTRYLTALNRDGFVTNFEFRARKKNGDIIWCSESSRTVLPEEEGGEMLIEGVVEDISARKLEELELKHLATVDSLTGVPNRHLFFDRLENALAKAKRYKERLAVLFVDLNEFKMVNDTYGHPIGDQLLCEVASRLQERIRESDTMARLGGDEFGILLPHVEDDEGAIHVAKTLLEALAEPFTIESELVRVGATVGISFYPKDGKDCVSLISRADAAMYGAKRMEGRNYCTFQECGAPR